MRFAIEWEWKKKKETEPPVSKATQNQATPQPQDKDYNTNNSPFSPGVPLRPFLENVEEPIQAQVPVGYNLTYNNAKKPGLSLLYCRALAEKCYGIRVVIESIKRQIRSLEWAITPIDGNTDKIRAKILTKVFSRPDGEHLFSDWIACLMEDLTVLGIACLAKLEKFNGEKAGLRIIDAATITPILTDVGTVPDNPNPAYYQVVNGVPLVEYKKTNCITDLSQCVVGRLTGCLLLKPRCPSAC
jgi:hypothetical protein